VRTHPYSVAYGLGAVMSLQHTASKLAAKRILVVCGERSLAASGAQPAITQLEQQSAVVRWSDFSPNVSIDDLTRGVDTARDVAPDLIIGIGGGSAMDMAKLISFSTTTAVNGRDIAEVVATSPAPVTQPAPLMLVPTTSGSGSEATHFAVAYIGSEKFSVAHPSMYATHVILDPHLVRSGSAHQRATSGIDAVCQAIESWWARGATSASRRVARHGLGYLLRSIREFVDDATPTAAQAMIIGSHLAGRAIDVSKTTGAHALSYHLTSSYGIDHGNAVALTLGRFIEAHSRSERPDVVAAMSGIMTLLGAHDGASARAAFERLVSDIGLRSDVRDVVTTDDTRRTWLSTVNAQRMSNNPVDLSDADLLELVS